MRPLLEIAANIADRSHHGPIATNRTVQKSYGPEIVRFGVTVALVRQIICSWSVCMLVDRMLGTYVLTGMLHDMHIWRYTFQDSSAIVDNSLSSI